MWSSYVIDADVNGKTQSLGARVAVRFVPLETVSNAVFELNNALTVSKVTDDQGNALKVTRNAADFTVNVAFPQPLEKGVAKTIRFAYDGHLTGNEDSPIYGIKFAAIHEDFAYLLYPARWFPVSGYTTDRFTANLNVTVPEGDQVVASGNGTPQKQGGKTVYSYQFPEGFVSGEHRGEQDAGGEGAV